MTASVNNGTNTLIGTLPADCTPSSRVITPIVFGPAGSILGFLTVQINKNVIVKQDSGAAQAYGAGNVMYFVD